MTSIHWRESLMEAVGLASFMVSALVLAMLLEHPASPIRQAVADSTVRRALMGVAMGLTAAAIVYSPWGRRSGAHLNPSVTLVFLRLGRIAPRDAGLYVLAQFAGGLTGVGLVAAVFGPVARSPRVNYVATVPGMWGLTAAFAGELAISFGMMSLILGATNTPRVARFTGLLAGCVIAIYITLEAPLSGMSMNPARSLAPALASGAIAPLWIYFIAPPLGMLLAAEVYVRRHGVHAVGCAKLHHSPTTVCHFNCQARRLTSTQREYA